MLLSKPDTAPPRNRKAIRPALIKITGMQDSQLQKAAL